MNEATKWYDKVLDMDDNNINALNGIAYINVLEHHYADTILNFTKLLELDGTNYVTLNGMALAKYKSADPQKIRY